MSRHRRFLSIDVLKGLGIIYLVFLHMCVWIFFTDDTGGLRFESSKTFISAWYYAGTYYLGLQIPLLAGATYLLAVRERAKPFVSVAARAAVLMLLGFGMNLLAWGPADAFDWDVLQFIGLCMVLTYPFVRYKTPFQMTVWPLAALAAAALIFAQWFPFPKFYGQYWYAVVFGSPFGEHYWPLFPWVVLWLAGFVVGIVVSDEDAKKWKGLMAAGVMLMLASVVSGDFFPLKSLDDVWGPAVFKPPAMFVLGVAGFSFIVVPGLALIFRMFPKWKMAMESSFITVLGRSILLVYLLSTIVGYPFSSYLVYRYQEEPFLRTLGLYYVASVFLLIVCYMFAAFSQRKKKVSYA